MRNRFITSPIYLLTVAVLVSVFVASCGDDESDVVVQVVTATAEPPAPTATLAPAATLAPTATQAPTATLAPTATAKPVATETPYWAKKILPGIAMEQYPPVNNRTMYELKNTQEWLNGGPTTIQELRESGRIVLVDFWTYT